MANNINIKFHRVSALPTSGYATGELYFVTSKNTIYLRTDDGWEIYDSDISKLPVKSGTGKNSLLSNDLDWSVASGEYSSVQGCSNTASGQASHAEGYETRAIGTASHSEGSTTIAKGDHTHAEGYNTKAYGQYSHSEGYGTIANNQNEHAEGVFNLSTKGVTQYSIGIGTSDAARKNAVEVTSEGKEYILGIGSYDGTNVTSAKDVATVASEVTDAVTTLNGAETTTGSVKQIAKQYADVVNGTYVIEYTDTGVPTGTYSKLVEFINSNKIPSIVIKNADAISTNLRNIAYVSSIYTISNYVALICYSEDSYNTRQSLPFFVTLYIPSSDGSVIVESESSYQLAKNSDVVANKVTAADKSLTVSATSTGTTAKVKLSSTPGLLTLESDGLSAKEVAYTGSNAINVNNHVISLNIDTNDKFLSQSASGILSTLSLSYNSTDKKIYLYGKDNSSAISAIDATDFIKDGMLDSASYNESTHILTLTFNSVSGKDAIPIDLSSLVDTYKAGTGLSLADDGTFSIDSTVTAHIASTYNPHKVTASQIGALATDGTGLLSGCDLNGTIDAYVMTDKPLLRTRARWRLDQTTTIISAQDSFGNDEEPLLRFTVSQDGETQYRERIILGSNDASLGYDYIEFQSLHGIKANGKEVATVDEIDNSINSHNTSADSHSDIRTLISNETATRENADDALDAKITTNANAISAETTAREAADSSLQSNINNKQDKLVSGTNIKTIGGTTLLGSGNIDIAPDASVSTDSENTVQNKVITSYVDTKVATINTSVSSISTRVTSVESQIGDIKTILASI